MVSGQHTVGDIGIIDVAHDVFGRLELAVSALVLVVAVHPVFDDVAGERVVCNLATVSICHNPGCHLAEDITEAFRIELGVGHVVDCEIVVTGVGEGLVDDIHLVEQSTVGARPINHHDVRGAINDCVCRNRCGEHDVAVS